MRTWQPESSLIKNRAVAAKGSYHAKSAAPTVDRRGRSLTMTSNYQNDILVARSQPLDEVQFNVPVNERD
jgi:hypothetical protein